MKNFRANCYPKLILLSIVCLIVPLIIVMIAIYQPYVDPKQFFLDPLSAAKSVSSEQCCSPHLGAISNLGVLMWAFSAGICLFSAYLTYSLKFALKYSFFLLNSGIISFMLMFDDMFLGHEKIYPYFFGIEEEYLMLIYGLSILGYIIFSYQVILQLDFFLLITSLFFFCLSILIDVGYSGNSPVLKPYGEDLNKLLGISFWTAFLIRSAWLICFLRMDRFRETKKLI